MDSLKVAKRMLDNNRADTTDSRACAYALIAIAEALTKEVDKEVDAFTATGNVYDLADPHEKNRGLMSELDRMRSRLTQCTLENERLEKWVDMKANHPLERA